MATLKWPSISERRSPTETTSNRIDLDRTRMPTNGLAKLTIRIPGNWMTQSRATSLGTEMATLRDSDRTGILANGMIEPAIRIPKNWKTQSRASKWPSISERRSPTETATNRIDLDRTGMSANGMIEPAIGIPRNWTTQSRATSLGTEMATLVAVDLCKPSYFLAVRWCDRFTMIF